ncbi:MAG: YkgJ family cysteine cluster protein [Promethearchaeota archaeon]
MGTQVHFECTKCGACCKEKELLVTVTGSDIVRLSFFLGTSTSETLRALDFYVLPENGGDPPAGMRDIPAVNTEHGAAYIALRRMENKECIFLSDDLCMIHQFRPGVCRSFPFVFREKEGETTWGLSAVKEICPGLGTGPEIAFNELKAISLPILRELSLYREFVSEWNKNQENPTASLLIESILSDSRFTA